MGALRDRQGDGGVSEVVEAQPLELFETVEELYGQLDRLRTGLRALLEDD